MMTKIRIWPLNGSTREHLMIILRSKLRMEKKKNSQAHDFALIFKCNIKIIFSKSEPTIFKCFRFSKPSFLLEKYWSDRCDCANGKRRKYSPKLCGIILLKYR